MSHQPSRSKDTQQSPDIQFIDEQPHYKKSWFLLEILRDTATGTVIAIISLIVALIIGLISIYPIINPPPTPTIISSTASPFSKLLLFREQHALTLYVPQGVDFDTSEFAWGIPNDTPTPLGMYSEFNLISSEKATCLRLDYSSTSSFLPDVCDNATIYTSQVAQADMFWYNDGLKKLFDITFFYKNELLITCPSSQSECEIPLN